MPTPLERLLPLLARTTGGGGETQSLDQLSNHDGRSRFHLQRVFRKTVGETPLQYGRRVRLQRAAAALVASDQSVLEIALDAGFASSEAFSRAFKKTFGVSPSTFREQRRLLASSELDKRRHLEIAQRAAPCLGLFRRSLAGPPHHINSGDNAMSYEVSKKTLEEVPFLFARREIAPEGIAEALGEMFGAVYGHATAAGIAFAGPPTARYPKYGPGLITIEAGMPIAGTAEATEGIMVGALHGGPVAATVHKGPYDTLSEAHQALEKWANENGEEAMGAAWEVYVTDPGEVPNPADWLTEINLPLG